MNPSENSKAFNFDQLEDRERAELLASLDEADRDIDEGRGCSADELRKAVRTWTNLQSSIGDSD